MIREFVAAVSKLFISKKFREACNKADQIIDAVNDDEIDLTQCFESHDFDTAISRAQSSYDILFSPHIGIINRHYGATAFNAAATHLDRKIERALIDNDEGSLFIAERCKSRLMTGDFFRRASYARGPLWSDNRNLTIGELGDLAGQRTAKETAQMMSNLGIECRPV